ncbi:hypothetical protein JHK87_043555 [Glycine soja]|nr:hypothetical protein JHK87_043555 [Glycine soja]
MLLKGLLSESDWLSEAHPLNEEVSLLSEYKTLENVESESSAQPTRPARMLSLLALSAQPLILAQLDMLAEHAFIS